MKKRRSIIPIGIMFIILAILLVYMALPLGQAVAGAVGGTADLRRFDLSEDVIQLSGEWQVVRGALLPPCGFPDETPVAGVPETWLWSKEKLNTCATYRLRICTDDTRALLMFIPEIYVAYKLWINGEFIRGAGIVADNRADASPALESALVSLKADNGIIEIVIQASNYHYMRPMMSNLILIGENDNMYSWFFRSRALYAMALGAFVLGVFYHLSLYIQRRKEIIYLLYVLQSLICFFRYSLDTNGMRDITGWFSTAGGLLNLKIFMVLIFLHGMAVSGFSMYVFDKEWLTNKRLWAFGYTAFGTVLFGLTPWNTYLAPLVVLGTLLPPVLYTIYRAAKSRKLRDERIMSLYFIALVFYAVVSVIQKYFFDHLLFMTGMIADLFLLMSQAIIISKQFVDVKEAEQTLEEKNAALDRLNRMKTEILQNLNHDLKTPLTVIATDVMNVTDMLEFGINEAQMRWNLENAEREIMRMSRMVTNAVKNSSLQDNIQDMEQLSILPLLREVADSFNSLLERSGNKLILEVPDTLPQVFGNEDMLMHVMSNLLSNANRYTRNGEISISAGNRCKWTTNPDPGRAPAGAKDFVTVSVKDTGTGVTPELLPHVFERGVSDSGTGLGLSICKNTIETHGGTIGIDSRPGEGTIVWFSIPAVHE